MKVALKIKNKGKFFDLEIPFNSVASIGRSRKCEFKLTDDKISAQHCKFQFKNNRLDIIDLDSKNGTYLNGILVDQSEVFIGDEVKIGDSIITLDAKNMSPSVVKTLTFPGTPKARMEYQLKANYSGAKLQKLPLKKVQPLPGRYTGVSQINHPNMSAIKLSKMEIRDQHQFKSFISLVLDSILLLVVLVLPLIGINNNLYDFSDETQKLIILLILEAFSLSFYLSFNFRILKFSFGEKISGIQRIYKKQ